MHRLNAERWRGGRREKRDGGRLTGKWGWKGRVREDGEKVKRGRGGRQRQ